ncbi:MAG: cobalamin-dependent protein [Clostridia bacterium]|nr:cobalamin-dependent protein [Clostridia bacterium]
MKKVYMVQPNSQYGNSVYLPYAAGSLAAYAFSDETVKKEYSFAGFVYKRTSIETVISELNDPFLIGFSCYVWNYEYNKKLASEVKKAFPECKIVFGGHQITADCELINTDYVDYCLTGEGEESFTKLLLYLSGYEEIDNVPNLIYKTTDGIRHTNFQTSELANRVSPYLNGYFDELVEKEELEFSAIIETNRGCPNRCAFCDWGNIKAKVRLFDIDMVKAEIDWISEHKIEFCFCADANFGLFPRDIEIIDYVIEKHNQNGYPQKFQASCSKTNPDTVFVINKKLNDSGLTKGATLSFQSLNQQVLENIYRKNMPLESFQKLMSMYNSNNIPAYSELILGLPGESYESFKNGIEQLLNAGQHMAMSCFNCEILGNSSMGKPEYREKHGIKYAITQQHQYHVIPQKEDDIPEFSRIVVSTNSMTEEMWIKSNILHNFVRVFHNLGLLQCVALYLYHEKNIRYTDFYCSLIEWAKNHPDSICGSVHNWIESKYRDILNNSGSLTCLEPEFGDITWPLEEGAFLKVVSRFADFYKEVSPFLEGYFDDKAFYGELMAYQKAVVKKPGADKLILDLHYDFYGYFSKIYSNDYSGLRKADTKLVFDLSDIPDDFKEYAKKTVWYGRKGGQNIVSNINYL